MATTKGEKKFIGNMAGGAAAGGVAGNTLAFGLTKGKARLRPLRSAAITGAAGGAAGAAMVAGKHRRKIKKSAENTSAFGVEHGEISKGLPSAVKAGGGGVYGSILRGKNQIGRQAAKMPKGYRKIQTDAGKQLKEARDMELQHLRVNQSYDGKASRRHRAQLLTEDGNARRSGWKSGKTSALDRGYRGRVSYKMTPLP